MILTLHIFINELNQKKITIDFIKKSENAIWIAGDGQYDSPGFVPSIAYIR